MMGSLYINHYQSESTYGVANFHRLFAVCQFGASGFWICVHHLAKAPAAQTGGGFERAFGVSHHSSSCKKRKVILSLSVIC